MTKTQGLRGVVRIEVALEDDRLFQPGRGVLIATDLGERAADIEFFRRQHGRTVLKLRGIDTIDQAQQIVGGQIQVTQDDLPPPEEGSFYTFQLKGCQVFGAGDEYLGAVTDVLDSGGTQILKVESDEEEILIPFAQSFLKNISLDNRRIDVELPEGLRELNK